MAEVDKKHFDISRKALGIPQDDRSEEKPAEAPKVDKVVTGDVIQKRKSGVQKLAETFLGGDVKDVGSYILNDVMIPAAKDMMYDMVSQGFQRLLFGESRQDRTRDRRRDYTSYASYYRGGSRDNRQRPATRNRNDFDDIILRTREDAEDVLGRMQDLAADYGKCTVADLYNLVGISSKYTDYDYGWTDLRGASISRTREGYLLNLPRTESLR